MSPIGRFLDRSAFDFLMKASPAAAIGKKLESSTDEMLQVEIGESFEVGFPRELLASNVGLQLAWRNPRAM